MIFAKSRLGLTEHLHAIRGRSRLTAADLPAGGFRPISRLGEWCLSTARLRCFSPWRLSPGGVQVGPLSAVH
jgi:hypothetical protein